MKLLLDQFQKAVVISTAFFILSSIMAVKAWSSINRLSYGELKKKTETLLLDKKRNDAFLMIDEFLKNSTNKNEIEKAKELKSILGRKFLTQEAQNYYEQSINLTLENKSESKKLIEQCLALEPSNLDCQIQNLRLEYRDAAALNKTKDAGLKIPKDLLDMAWLKFTVSKKEKEFKNAVILKKVPSTSGESLMVLTILELERAMQFKNYALAKEALTYLEKYYPDWPEIILFKQKIDTESSENQAPLYEKNQNQDIVASYQAKCKNLNKTLIRKFRYDFDLCLRGG